MPISFTMYVSGRFNVVENHLPSIHMYADDIQLYLSFMPLSTSPQHGALRAIQASVSDKNSWDPSTQHCFYFWPFSWSSQCWLSQLAQQILHTNIGRARRQQSGPTILTETVVSQTFKLGWSPTKAAQDKRYKNGLSLCGFPPTAEQGTT